MTAPCPAGTLHTAPWFGKPGAMEQLPTPDRGYTMPRTRGTVLHQLVSGGTSSTRRPWPKRTYALSWSERTADAADPMLAYWTGVMGAGPWCIVDPAWRNHLDQDTSTMGRRGIGTGWVTLGTGAAVRDATLTPPAAAPRSGVLRWSGAAVGASALSAGVPFGAGVDADPLFAPVTCPGLPVCISLYARAATGTVTVTPSSLSRNGDGSLISSTVFPAVVLTTTWQRIVMASNIASTATFRYLLPALSVTAGGTVPDIWVAAAQFEYGVLTPRPFLVGAHVPRVTFGDLDGSASSTYARRTSAYILAET